jgi:hypothetical protein
MNFLDLYNKTAEEGVIRFLVDESLKYERLITNRKIIQTTDSVELIKYKVISDYLESELEKRQKKED